MRSDDNYRQIKGLRVHIILFSLNVYISHNDYLHKEYTQFGRVKEFSRQDKGVI